MIYKDKVIEQFFKDLSCKGGTGNGIGYGTVEKLRQFAIREGYIKDENKIAKD